MNTSEEILRQENEDPNRREIDKMRHVLAERAGVKIYPKSLMYGIISGLLIGLYLVFLGLAGMADNIYLNFSKLIILVGILGIGLYNLRKECPLDTYFPKGIELGGLTTLFCALTLGLVYVAISVAMPETNFSYGFSEPVAEDINSSHVFAGAGSTFFETLVAGLIGTFIWLQYFKGREIKE